MARIFPDSPVGALPPETLRAFRFLKNLPDGYAVWHHLAPWDAEAPDFLLLDPERRALVVKVCTAAHSAAQPAAQMLLVGQDRPLGEVEEALLERFCARLQAEAGLGEPVARAVLFANIPGAALFLPGVDRAGASWMGKEALGEAALWQPAFRGPPLREAQVEQARALFAPEVVVPAGLTVRQPEERRLAAGLTDFLLDYDQEAVLKNDLELPPEGQGLARDFGLNVVNGVAGSGKTLILLYRLRLLHGLYPHKRFLVLTHNRPLLRDLKSRYRLLTGRLPARRQIEWDTFSSWCKRHWPQSHAWEEPLGIRSRDRLIEEVYRAVLSGSSLTAGMLRSEINWWKDQPLSGREAYLNADRRGRGFRLSQAQRHQVAEAMDLYSRRLRERKRIDWGDVGRHMWRFIQDGQVRPPVYDAVLIDEAQFFAPVWFEIVRGLVRPKTGHLFVAADPTQGFLGRGVSWRSLGLDVRGHTHRLERSYRTTREILNFATLFYRQRIPNEDPEEAVLALDLLNLPGGAFPQLIPLQRPQDEIARVVNEIAAFIEQGYPKEHLLVLHADWRGVQALVGGLERRLGRGAAGDPKRRDPGGYVRVTTLNAGTGLESPVVFLVGMHRMFEQEQSLRLSDEEREILVRENTRKIYMAATRAGRRLVLTYVGNIPQGLGSLLKGFL